MEQDPAEIFVRICDDIRRLPLPAPVQASLIATICANLPMGSGYAALADPPTNLPRRLHAIALHRDALLGEGPWTNPAWNMLLHLSADRADGRTANVTGLCAASGAPPTTGLRHLAALEQAGFIARLPDRTDRRRTRVEPTPRAETVLSRLFRDLRTCCD